MSLMGKGRRGSDSSSSHQCRVHAAPRLCRLPATAALPWDDGRTRSATDRDERRLEERSGGLRRRWGRSVSRV